MSARPTARTGAGPTLVARDRTRHPPALHAPYRSTAARSPRHPPLALPLSLGEATGPVFGDAAIGELDADLMHNFAAPGACAIGQRLVVHGRLLDGDGRGVPNALIEVWQANAGGRYRHRAERYVAELDPNFGGCGRTLTDGNGHYSFRTVQPGAYPWPNGPNSWRPAHIHFSVFGHAFAQRLVTQMYFEGDPLIRRCPIVDAIPSPEGVDSLVARLDMDATVPMDALAYRFDIVLRGRGQTAFERPEGA